MNNENRHNLKGNCLLGETEYGSCKYHPEYNWRDCSICEPCIRCDQPQIPTQIAKAGRIKRTLIRHGFWLVLCLLINLTLTKTVLAVTCYEATGFDINGGPNGMTSTQANGTYEESGGTQNGDPLYQNNVSGAYLQHQVGGDYWVLDLATGSSGSSCAYYDVTGGAGVLTTGLWSSCNGPDAHGAFATTTCPAGEITNDGATSTPEQAQQNVFNGVIIMFITFFTLIFITKK